MGLLVISGMFVGKFVGLFVRLFVAWFVLYGVVCRGWPLGCGTAWNAWVVSDTVQHLSLIHI